MDSIRQNKVSRLIQKEIITILQQDCREYCKGSMISVTKTRVSADLSYANIYISIFPSSTTDTVMQSMNDNMRNIRYILEKKIGKQVRIIPELRFFADDSLDYIEKIDRLLK